MQPPDEGRPQPPQQPYYPPQQYGQLPNEGRPQPPQQPYYPPQPQQPYGPPYPQQPMYQPPPPRKRSRAWLWIVLGVLAVLLLGCIGIVALVTSAAKTTSTGTISSSTSTSSGNTPSSTNQIAKIGQTITIDGVGTTLVSVKTLGADSFTQPKPGNEFIVAHIKMHNTNNSEKDYNPFDFHVKSGAGNITDEEVVAPQSYTGNNRLNVGKLAAGGTVEGDLIFQVPKGDHKAELTWQPSYFGNAGDNGWNLGL